MGAKPDTWMPLYVGDYLADTMHLTNGEHGAYLLLIMHYWRHGPLPDDDRALAAIARADAREWARIKASIRGFFLPQDGTLRHKRIDAELSKAKAVSSKRALAANARWMQAGCKPDAKSMHEPCKSDANAYAHAYANAYANASSLHMPGISRVQSTEEEREEREERKEEERKEEERGGGVPVTPNPREAAPIVRPPLPSSPPNMAWIEGITPGASGTGEVDGYDVDVLLTRLLEAAHMDLSRKAESHKTVVGWLRDGFDTDEMLAWVKRKALTRKPPGTLAGWNLWLRQDLQQVRKRA
jgi:uncharacterized protein YdaU (DUF1376 family)